MSVFYWVAWSIVAPFMRIFFPTRVYGKEHQPKGRAIFACNHTSNLDIILIECCRCRKSYVLAKHTLFKNKFIGKCLQSLGGVPVNREEVGTSTIRTTIKLLEEDNHLILFPEGTRKETLDETTALKNGMALFALKTKSPIVPMYIAKKPRPFVFNKMFYGEPIDLTKYYDMRSTKEVLTEVSALVMDEMQKMKHDYEATLSPRALARRNRRIERDEKRRLKRIEKHTARKAKKEEKAKQKQERQAEKSNKEDITNPQDINEQ